MLSAPLSAVCLQEACTVHNHILPPVSSVLHMCAVSSLESGEPHQVCFFRPIVLTVRPRLCSINITRKLVIDAHAQAFPRTYTIRGWVWSPALCVFTSPPGSSDVHSHLSTAVLVNSPLPLPFFQLLHSTKHLVGNVFICYSFIHSVLAGDLLSPG